MDLMKNFVYQIYIKSFNDSNGDGIGDLNGICEKVSYLKELGVDYIWITPFYKSPLNDNGYDISNYYEIHEDFGTFEDFDNLVKECDKYGIKIMIDMVFNHTSTEHEWFKKAMNGDEKYKDFYIFRKGVNGKPPTNWASKFGGSAWEYVEKFDEYYLHLFDVTQGDLNWDNKEVREEIYKVVDFWKNKGVKGFRFDVVNLISKPEVFEDDFEGDGRRFYTDGPNIHKYLKELSSRFPEDTDFITVGEMSSTSLDNLIKYSNPKEKELSMVFNFHHLKVDYKNGDKWTLMDFDFMELKRIFKYFQYGMKNGGGVSALFYSNHDQPRVLSRFGDDEKFHNKSGKMLLTSVNLMRGVPYIYQGEEIGMTNAYFSKIEDYRDVESLNYYEILKKEGHKEEEILKILRSKSRDNGRTPMQWNNKEHSGFTTGIPWINVCKNYKEINAESQINDENSIFNYTKNLISLRKNHSAFINGDIEFIFEEHNKIFSYIRKNDEEKILVICNFYGENEKITLENIIIKDVKKIFGNYDSFDIINNEIVVRPYEAMVLLI